MRRIIKKLFLGILGIVLGLLVYEGYMFSQIWRLKAGNPTTTSLIDARASESQAEG